MCFILKKKFPVYICSTLLAWSRGVSGCGSLAWLLRTELSERTHHLHARGGFSPFLSDSVSRLITIVATRGVKHWKVTRMQLSLWSIRQTTTKRKLMRRIQGGRGKVEFISCTLHFTPCGWGLASCTASISWWPSKNSKWKATISK